MNQPIHQIQPTLFSDTAVAIMNAAANSVGKSNRTLGKHILLDKIIGREIGVLQYGCPPFLNGDYMILDLCAGDGKPTFFSGMSSPQIIMKHTTSRPNVKVFFFEKDVNTFATLTTAYPTAYSFNMNALDLEYLPEQVKSNSSVFIHCDPNMITDWAISSSLLRYIPKFTTMLITLGCNVGGLKRLSFDKRKEWFEKLDEVLAFLPKWHDALLVALAGDKAQWAYLITGPKKWHDVGIYVKDASRAFSYWQYGIETIQFRKNEKNFYKLRDRLFLTKKEFEDAR